jgi:hypothetical protein
MMGIHHQSAKRMLRDDVNMRNANFKLVPYGLDSFQKVGRAQGSRELLDFLESRTD